MISIQKITAKETWPIRHRVMYPEMKLMDMVLQDDQEGEHLGLFENGQLVSVVSLFVRRESAQFRKLATIVEKQNLGYGRALLDYIINYSISLNVKRIWCNARKNKLTFYKKAGFYETDQTFFKDGHDFVIMNLDV